MVCSPWGHKEPDTTEQLTLLLSLLRDEVSHWGWRLRAPRAAPAHARGQDGSRMLTSAALHAPSCRPHTLAGTHPCWCPLPLCQPLDGDPSPSFPVHDLCQHRQHEGWPPKDPRDAGHSLSSVGRRSNKGPRWPQLTHQCWRGTSSLIPSLEVIPSHALPWGLWEKAWATGVPPEGRAPPFLHGRCRT